MFNHDSDLAIKINTIKNEFEKFKTILDGHEFLMHKQVDEMKISLKKKLTTLNDDSERLFLLWNQFKPNNDLLFTNDINSISKNGNDRMKMIKAIEFVRENRQKFTQLNDQCKKLM